MKRLRVEQTAALSLTINTAYGLYNGVLGYIGQEWWFVALAAYYLLLGVMRVAVLLSARKRTAAVSPLFVRRFCGVLLIALAITLAGTTYLSVQSERGIRHHEIVMITIALYTFTKITLAILHLVKARGNTSLTVKTLRDISFADALVSIFSLQRSMLVSFEGMAPTDIVWFNGLTGTAIYVAVCIVGIYLIEGGNNRGKTETGKSQSKNR